MRKLVTGMQSNRVGAHGFTLIEILVVVLIVGITIGFALLAFGDFGSKRRIVMSAEQFVNYVKFAQQQAIMETSTLGISVNNNSYQLMRFQSTGKWSNMSQKNVFRQQHFPDSAVVRLENTNNIRNAPQIIINSSGDMTTFKLIISSVKQVNIASVIGRDNGTVVLKLIQSP